MGSRSHFKTFEPVETAHAIDANQVSVSFADGTTAVIDLSDIKGQGPWAKLQDPAFFKRVHAAFSTIV